MENALTRAASSSQREQPPLIDCSKPVKLADRPGLPEQYHVFEAESALAIRAALGACRPLLVRGEPGVGKTQLAAAAARALEAAAGPEGRRVAYRITRAALGVRRGPAPGRGPDRRRRGVTDPGAGSRCRCQSGR